MDTDIIREGLLKKKKSRVTTWGERYFKLKPHSLEYYIKPNDSVRFLFVFSFCCKFSLFFFSPFVLGTKRGISIKS
jgi:hypothetical protein